MRALFRGTGQCRRLSHSGIAFVKVKFSSGSGGEARTDDNAGGLAFGEVLGHE